MAQELTEELKVFVTAEVNNAISNLQKVDKQTKAAESSFKVLGKTISAAFIATEIIKFSKQSIAAWETQNQAVEVLNASLQATGATAWTSSKQLQEMASSLQKITNYGDETIIQMQSVLLGFKNIKGDTFEDATKAILDMATVMKMDLSSAAQAVGKALDDPINGITSLQRQGFRFSEAQKEVIQALIETGDMAAAQKIILDELNGTYGGAAEAAATASAQIKNAWGDLQEGVGAFLTGFADSKAAQKVVSGIMFIADAFAKFHENVAFLRDTDTKGEEAFSKYYNGLKDIEDKIRAAEIRTAAWTEEEDKLNKKLANGRKLSAAKREELEKELAAAKERAEYWDAQVDANYKTANLEIIIAQRKAEELEATSAIEELMTNIASDYEKLSKDDPVIQLQKYQQQLDKIQKDKETLSSTTTGLDTADAIRQLDYNAEKIKARMQEIRNKLQDDGKKSWQSYFEKVTGVSASNFTTGKEAGQLYIDGLSKAFNDAESLSALLGKKFDAKAAIESQMRELEVSITKLLDVPADKINEVYSTADDSIKAMIDEYKRLNEEKKKFEVSGALEELNTKVQQLTMSERDLYIQKLQNNGATAEQIEQANALLKVLEEAQKKSGKTGNDISDKFISWEDELEKKLLSGIENLQLFKENAEESNKALAEMGVTLTSMSFSTVLQGFGALGEALGKGESAGEGLRSALEETATAILDQLPMLFLQAGLSLIAQGQWALGLGLVTAGLGTQAINGFVNGRSNVTETNALGGVYGSTNYEAFAQGGTFTNSIVNQPTLFKFARGSGFGTGLMGEAGPEAIMPLERGPDGALGVRNFGASANVMIIIKNYSGAEVQTSESTEGGQRRVEVMIGAAINNHISSGKADRAMSSRYGLKAQGV